MADSASGAKRQSRVRPPGAVVAAAVEQALGAMLWVPDVRTGQIAADFLATNEDRQALELQLKTQRL